MKRTSIIGIAVALGAMPAYPAQAQTAAPEAAAPEAATPEAATPEAATPQTAAPEAAPAEDPNPLDDLRAQNQALAADIEALRQDNQALRQDSEYLREDLTYLERQVRGLLPLTGRLTGYLDLGFFHVTGTGAGHRADTGNLVFPEYEDVSMAWVFLGDPLSTAVNARGEPARTGSSRGVVFDPIGARSAFLVNTLTMKLFAAVSEDLTVTGAVHFVPRGRDVSDPGGLFLGDFVDVSLAYLEYRVPTRRLGLSLYAGKLDSVLGYEYRVQQAPDRIGATPSLLCRYLCGHPVGVKARGRFLDDALVVNLALTNGSHFAERFAFADELDENRVKTVAGRISYRLPVAQGLEIGVSGAVGAQDGQPADDVLQYHVGADAHLVAGDLDLVAEYVSGEARGQTDTSPDAAPCDLAPCIDYEGAYLMAGYRATNLLVPYARLDWRDALHRSGRSFVYISALLRATAGARLELGTHVIIKAEYTLNRELGRIPQFPNDVLTTSLVVTY